jgi:FAD:protein FMN transferase
VSRTGTDEPSTQYVYRTRALGTAVDLVVHDGPVVDASELLQAELRRIDRVASRFRSDSELEALNAEAGHPHPVSADLLESIEVALAMADATDGLVDPTVGNAMHRLGYDRDFDEVRHGVDGVLPAPTPVPGWRSLAIDLARQTVFLPTGTALDLGATAKALAADRAARHIHHQLGCGVLVSMGGDVAVAGTPPVGGFVVGLADRCADPAASEAVAISSGGLASSGTAVRHWALGTHPVHHIVDPATGLPAPVHWRTVAVTAASCVQANAASTAAIILGADAVDWLEARRLPARLVGRDGRVVYTTGWPAPATGLVHEEGDRS